MKKNAFYQAIPSVGVVLCIAAMFANTAMDTLGKFATNSLSSWQLVFLRWLFGLLLLLPPMLIQRKNLDWQFKKKVHINRMVLNLVGSLCLFYSLGKLPLSVVVTIFFMEPLVTVIFARIILAEHISAVRWLCTILSFVAVMIVSLPSGSLSWKAINFNSFIALIGASAWGLMRVLTKRDRENTSTLSLMFWMALTTTIFALPGAFMNWRPISTDDWLIIFGIAILGNAYNYFWLRALNIVHASYIANFFFLLLPLSYIAGYVFFHEIPPFTVYLGSAAILLLVFISTHRTTEQKIMLIATKFRKGASYE